MLVSGVRNSCETAARNSLLAWLAERASASLMRRGGVGALQLAHAAHKDQGCARQCNAEQGHGEQCDVAAGAPLLQGLIGAFGHHHEQWIVAHTAVSVDALGAVDAAGADVVAARSAFFGIVVLTARHHASHAHTLSAHHSRSDGAVVSDQCHDTRSRQLNSAIDVLEVTGVHGGNNHAGYATTSVLNLARQLDGGLAGHLPNHGLAHKQSTGRMLQTDRLRRGRMEVHLHMVTFSQVNVTRFLAGGVDVASNESAIGADQ